MGWTIETIERRRAYYRPSLQNFPTPMTSQPPHISIIPSHGNIHAALRYYVLLCATWETFTLSFAKYFLHALTLIFFWYFRGLTCSSHSLNVVTRTM